MADNRLAIQAAIKRATFAAQREMDRLDAAALDELERLYRQAAEDIRARIASHAGQDGNVSLAQLQELLAQVNARLRALSETRDRLLAEGMKRAVELGVQPLTAAGIGVSLEPLLDGYTAALVADAVLRGLRGFIAADGLQLSDRIWRLDRQAREIIGNAIESAIIQGHGAAQAAYELLADGKPVSSELADKLQAGNAGAMGKQAAQLLTGKGSPMDNAMRVMRTELNRAHGEAYIAAALKHPDAVGLRFLLSPAHPEFDECDFHAAANLYGLGRGVYPTREKCPWPAHPNTLSYVEVVFKDEVSAEDKAGKETPMEALGRLPDATRRGVLGKGKDAIYQQGKLTQGMIKAPLRAVRKRIGQSVNGGARLLPQMVTPYEIAKAGGKHHGWYLRQIELDDAELSKAIRSFERQIAKHEQWVDDPLSKAPDFGSFDPRRQVALIDGWKQDAARHHECIEILRRILKERKNG